MKNRITIETTINKPVVPVWNSWTDPKHVINWNFATDEWHCPKATSDFNEGGHFSYTMASKDGKMAFDLEGVFDMIQPMKRIEYTLSDGRKVSIIFEKISEQQTRVEQSFEPESINDPEMQRLGWQAILNNFKKFTEK